MNAQQIFDTVALHLFQQKHPATKDGGCVYRAPNGDKCAVGCLISDEDYTDRMEGFGIYKNGPQSFVFSELPDWFTFNAHLLSDLQSVHDANLNDSWDSPFTMVQALRKVAIDFKLSHDVLNPFVNVTTWDDLP